MARKSRKNMPVAVAEPTVNLTAKAVLSMDKEAKPYQVGIYARLSFESEGKRYCRHTDSIYQGIY